VSLLSVILRSTDKKALHVQTLGGHTHLVVQPHDKVASQFRSISFSVAGTTSLVAPLSGIAIILTDLIISAEKVVGGDVLVQFTDGSNSIPIVNPIVVDAPVNLAIAFGGRWRGWDGARVEVIATGTNISGNVAVGYYPIRGEGVLPFAEWDAER
jgi:hypothetical protein